MTRPLPSNVLSITQTIREALLRIVFIFSTLLVVGECKRCFAYCTNTNNGEA